MMIGLYNHKLSYIMIKEAGLEVTKSAPKVTDEEIRRLVYQMKEFLLPVCATNTFENAQVTAGGAATGELNEKTLESKLHRRLYLTGELVDVDGTCGGYNLQWAWSTGYLAGTAAGRQNGDYHD
jgi:predicted flavoprotein YhiN